MKLLKNDMPNMAVVDKKNLDLNIKDHVSDKTPIGTGNKEALGRLRGVSFGCEQVVIQRTVPAVMVDSLVLEKGCSKVLVGPNGAGKSTIFDAIMELANGDAWFDTQGGKGAVLYGVPAHIREKLRISRLNQEEVLNAIKDMQVADVLRQAMEKFQKEFVVDWEDGDKYDANLANEEARQRIEQLYGQIIKLFNIDEFLDRQVSQLSGGEKTKLSIFTLLMSEPDIMLLDEPTNHLDLKSIAKLAALFKAYNDAGVAILSVSHVDWYLREVGRNGVFEITFNEGQRKVESSSAPYDRFVKDRARQDFTVIENDLVWRNKDRVHEGAYLTPLEFPFSIPDSPLVDIEIDSLKAGEVWVLSGDNGTGKTKLMQTMALPHLRRHIFEKTKGVNIAYMPQFWPSEVAEGNLENFFNYIKDQINPHSELTAKRFNDAIRKIGFIKAGESALTASSNWMRRKLSQFSGGEQRLLWFLAVSCFDDVDCLMLDEPTNHMDKNLQEFVVKAIRNFPGAVVLSTHDVKLLEDISSNIGNKVGGGIKAKNIVLEKNNGRTRISVSTDSPVVHMQKELAKAQAEARKFKF